MNSLREEVFGGFNWNLATQVVGQLLNFLIGIILARILSPKEFGLVAMVTVLFGFVDVVKEFGLGAFVIHKPTVNEKELSVVFWLSLIGGVIATGIFVVIAPLVAAFYGKPVLQSLTVFLSLNFIFSSLAVVPSALLQKSLSFKAMFNVMIYTEFLSSLVAVCLAIIGFGVWSIAARLVVRSFMNAILVWFFSSWQPLFYFDRSTLNSINKFSLPLIGTYSINYWVRNLDDLLIGKMLGDKALGDYSRAYSFLKITLGQLGYITSRFAFPVFSKLQSDNIKLRDHFLKMNRLIAVVFFPLMIMLFFTAKEIVLILLGEQWKGAIPLLEIFAITGLLQVLIAPIGVIFMSLGETRRQFQLGLWTSSVGIISIIIGLKWGAYGVAIALLVATLINLFPNIQIACKLIKVSFFDWLDNLTEVSICFFFYGLVLFIFGEILQDIPDLLVLTANLFTGSITYLIMVFFLRLEVFAELRFLVKTLTQNLK